MCSQWTLQTLSTHLVTTSPLTKQRMTLFLCQEEDKSSEMHFLQPYPENVSVALPVTYLSNLQKNVSLPFSRNKLLPRPQFCGIILSFLYIFALHWFELLEDKNIFPLFVFPQCVSSSYTRGLMHKFCARVGLWSPGCWNPCGPGYLQALVALCCLGQAALQPHSCPHPP